MSRYVLAHNDRLDDKEDDDDNNNDDNNNDDEDVDFHLNDQDVDLF